ncbi:UNVERIFIED_CONTAM: hypothetical protein HHA_449380 [Hammondia hammondi]|eukprot:XP_008882070.1 hypothetical protein HHA_449380 [Hammondia hammondi]
MEKAQASGGGGGGERREKHGEASRGLKSELGVAAHEVKTLKPGRSVYVQQGDIFIESDPQKALAFLEWRRQEVEKNAA